MSTETERISREGIELKIREIIAEKIEKKKFENNKPFEELGADSLDITEVIIEIEEEFAVDMSKEDYAKINTPGKLIAYVQNKANYSKVRP
ncbi:acyl carrier protein [Candidatus Pacearchaeota archaeon]|nr:acyl carrier protein [Candidatus Pacearchaeota archaeon]